MQKLPDSCNTEDTSAAPSAKRIKTGSDTKPQQPISPIALGESAILEPMQVDLPPNFAGASEPTTLEPMRIDLPPDFAATLVFFAAISKNTKIQELGEKLVGLINNHNKEYFNLESRRKIVQQIHTFLFPKNINTLQFLLLFAPKLFLAKIILAIPSPELKQLLAERNTSGKLAVYDTICLRGYADHMSRIPENSCLEEFRTLELGTLLPKAQVKYLDNFREIRSYIELISNNLLFTEIERVSILKEMDTGSYRKWSHNPIEISYLYYMTSPFAVSINPVNFIQQLQKLQKKPNVMLASLKHKTNFLRLSVVFNEKNFGLINKYATAFYAKLSSDIYGIWISIGTLGKTSPATLKAIETICTLPSHITSVFIKAAHNSNLEIFSHALMTLFANPNLININISYHFIKKIPRLEMQLFTETLTKMPPTLKSLSFCESEFRFTTFENLFALLSTIATSATYLESLDLSNTNILDAFDLPNVLECFYTFLSYKGRLQTCYMTEDFLRKPGNEILFHLSSKLSDADGSSAIAQQKNQELGIELAKISLVCGVKFSVPCYTKINQAYEEYITYTKKRWFALFAGCHPRCGAKSPLLHTNPAHLDRIIKFDAKFALKR